MKIDINNTIKNITLEEYEESKPKQYYIAKCNKYSSAMQWLLNNHPEICEKFIQHINSIPTC